jgi:hypothetical protein
MRTASVIVLGLLVSASCSFDKSATGGGGGVADGDGGTGTVDADPSAPDAAPNAPDAAPPCLFGSVNAKFVDVCNEQPTSGLVTLTLDDRRDGPDYLYDTDDGELLEYRDEGPPQTAASQPLSTVVGGVRVIWVDTWLAQGGSSFFARGTLPLAIVAEGNITVDGLMSVESTRRGFIGAGAQPSACSLPAVLPGAGQTCQNHGASGGGGGAFRGNGGTGGGVTDRDCDGSGNPLPTTTGGTGTPLPPSTLRGGCAGAFGADSTDGDADDVPAPGGGGGGAIYLLAKGTLLVNGFIFATGGGGTRGDDGRSSGGGGGSGGYLVLQAGTVQLSGSALVLANGGGGGGGGNDDDGTHGEDGRDGDQDTAPVGGLGDNSAGDGGDGGYRGDINGGIGETSTRGGGGGGGGSGFVVIDSPNLTIDPSANVSPEPCGAVCN